MFSKISRKDNILGNYGKSSCIYSLSQNICKKTISSSNISARVILDFKKKPKIEEKT